MEDYFVKMISVKKEYRGAAALDGVSLGLYKGRTLGLFGGKQAGKSVFCRLLCGAEKPSEGKVLLDGKPIGKKAKRRIAMLLNESIILKFKTVKALFEFYEEFYDDFDRKRSAELMCGFGIDPDKKIVNNKGVNQLIGLCLMGGRKAELYVLDEPLSYFDRGEREEYLKTVIKGLEGKPLVVIAAEYLRGLEGLIDDAAFLHEGRIKLVKTCEEIRNVTGKGVEDFYKEVFGSGSL